MWAHFLFNGAVGAVIGLALAGHYNRIRGSDDIRLNYFWVTLASAAVGIIVRAVVAHQGL